MANNSPGIVILDMDRTLFDTDRFLADILEVIAESVGVDVAKLANEIDQYRFTSADQRYYDMFSHVKAHGLMEAEARTLITARLGATDYAFADVAPLIEALREQGWQYEVLTFGDPRFQDFKAGFMRLPKLELDVTLGPKSKHLLRKFGPDMKGYIIDDKIVPDLPRGLKQLLVCRGEVCDETNATIIHSLAQAIDILADAAEARR